MCEAKMMADKYGSNKVFVISNEKYIYNIRYDHSNDAQIALNCFNTMYANCARMARKIHYS